MKSIVNMKYWALAIVAAVAMQFSFISCSDDPGVDNYYTSTAEFAGDYISNRSQFSKFSRIVERSNMMNLLNTYGSLTLFAPTNEAVDKYLAGRGLTSVEQLSKADCDTITYTHIIDKKAYFTIEMSNGTYDDLNMLDRPLQITTTADSLTTPGEILLDIQINRQAQMIHWDDSVANGVVHTMADVIGSRSVTLPEVLGEDPNISLFYEALVLTHMDDSLRRFIDENYSVGYDSINWTNDALVMHTASEYDNVAYMERRYFKYTAFCPTDDVFRDKYNVTDMESLKRLAEQIYADKTLFPCTEAEANDPTSRNNPLNRFISYHLLDRYGTYYSLTAYDRENSPLAKAFARTNIDIADWYETMMPYSILKCSYPYSTDRTVEGLYVNRRGIMTKPDRQGYQIRGAKVAKASEMEVNQAAAINGIYHYIDDILFYGTNPVTGVVATKDLFSERLRFDASTLSPDFMTSGARGHATKQGSTNNNYGIWQDEPRAVSNRNTCLGFKAGSAKNFFFTDQTHVHVRNRYLNFWSYQADEVTVKGNYDLTVKIPPVPEGMWEVRLFTCVGFNSRGIVQFYIDGQPQGIPFDMRPNGDSPVIGWKSDTGANGLNDDAEQIAAFDRQFHARGWMKGMKSYMNNGDNGERSWEAAGSFRMQNNTLRRVIGQFYSDGHSDHYVRFQQRIDSSENEMNFDVLELCPAIIYDNPDVVEDPW